MLQQFIVFGCMLQMAFAAPQFVTFKDGKVGVNFAGYHAEAGLGGLLTGNAAHGGLSASAGTPWGPQAAAGLNGALDGRAVGNAYAGAQYSPEVGASSVIGGTAGQQGFAGAEAHSHGKVSSKTISSQALGLNANYVPQQTEEVATSAPQTTNIQKIKPPKKYSVLRHEGNTIGNVEHSKHVVKSVVVQPAAAPVSAAVATNNQVGQYPTQNNQYQTKSNVQINGGLLGSVLNIPIGVLRSLQESITALDINKSVTYTHN